MAGVVGGVARAPLALFEPVAVAVHFQDMDVVGQSVEQCTGQTFGGEDTGPFVERQIAGDDGGTALVAPREHLEQQLCAGLRERHVAEFVKAPAGGLPASLTDVYLLRRTDAFLVRR